MIVQRVIVSEVASDHLWLEPASSGCESCQQGSCGAFDLSAIFGKRVRGVKIANPGGFEHYEQAELLMESRLFVKSLLIQYGVPLLGLFVFVLAAEAIGLSPIVQAVLAGAGLATGFYLARRLIRYLARGLSGHHVRIRHCADDASMDDIGVEVIFQ